VCNDLIIADCWVTYVLFLGASKEQVKLAIPKETGNCKGLKVKKQKKTKTKKT
jgi:hypothetical protein